MKKAGKNIEQKHSDYDDVEIIEMPDGEASNEALKIKKVKEKLKACEQEKKEYLEGWQRAKADFINSRRENEEKRKELTLYATENVLFTILPVADSFEIAFKNKEAWERVDLNWRKGIEYIHAQLLKTLEENGLVPITPKKGEDFEPLKHESIESIYAGKEKEHGKIYEVVQMGYEIGNKVLRPARVKVSIYKKCNKNKE